MTTGAPPGTRPAWAERAERLGPILVLAALVLALGSPWLPLPDAGAIHPPDRLEAPLQGDFVLGSDALGRSVASRLVAGLAWSLGVAGLASLLSCAAGVTVGLVMVLGPAPLVRSLRGILDLTMSFPTLVLAIAVVSLAGQGFWTLVLVLAVVSWPVFARVVEAEGLTVKGRDHVLAARLYNLPEHLILWRHVLPQVYPSLLVVLAFHIADMLIAESALSFLGIGAPLGVPTWGNMLSESRQYLHNAPWLMLTPATAIVALVVALNLSGDWLVRRFHGRARGR